MNKLAIALSAALSLGAVASANAADATINFSGTIDATSCAVGIDGAATAGTVALNRVSKTVIESGSAAVRETPFTVQVGTTGSSCPAGTMEVHFSGANVHTDGTLNNGATGTATNVSLELEHKGLVLDLNGAKIEETLTAAGVYSYPMKARYKRTAAGTDVGPGTFVSSVDVDLVLR